MLAFTQARVADTPDELWFLEHEPVYTLGISRRREHVIDPGPIPVIETDRGGQVTYHGPGQLVAYTLLDLRRRNLDIRSLVSALEQSVIALLDSLGIAARSRCDAPGVYVAGAKIASIGLRIRHGCSYHGMALNVAMDLAPFARINPCGFPGMAVTDLRELGGPADLATVREALLPELISRLAPLPPGAS